MKVKDLIKELQENFDPNEAIHFYDSEYGPQEVDSVVRDKHWNNIVCMYG